MIIKKIPEREKSTYSKYKKIVNTILYGVFILNIIGVIGVFVFFKSYPDTTAKIYAKLESKGLHNIKYIPEILTYKIKSLFYSTESINIDIKHMDMQKIEFMRKNALSGDREFEFVSGKLNYGNSKYKIKLRIKGDRKTHYNELDKTSYRIEIKNGNTLFGMKNFSMQKPRARNYMEEWIFLQMMRDEGMVTPRYKFVNVSINGKDQGVYVLEEHYTKYLVESNRYKEGPILKFEENTHNFELETIKPFELKKWNEKRNFPKVQRAISLLEGFRSGKLSIDETFDSKKLARFFAIADLNLAWHGTVTKSMRFYYNPITLKLEPVPYDGHSMNTDRGSYWMMSELGIESNKNWTYNAGYGSWYRKFFNNQIGYSKVFYEEYIKTLERITKQKYLNNFFVLYDNEINDILKLIYSELPLHDNAFNYGPFPYYFNKKGYYHRQKDIKKKLKAHDILAKIKKTKDKIVTISVVNKHKSLPYEIVRLFNKKKEVECFPLKAQVFTVEESLIKKIRPSRDMKLECNKTDENFSDFQIEVKYPGSSNSIKLKLFPYPMSTNSLISKDIIRRKPNVEQFDFINVDEKNRIILIKKGEHSIRKDLIVPAGYTFIIEKGTELNLIDNPTILSYSKLEWIGSKDEKISIKSDIGKSGSITVLNANDMSRINYVNFINLSYPKLDYWMISGSVNFYESDVSLNNVTVSSNNAEDGINIVRSNFYIANSSFINIKSDALDIDFGEGKVINTFYKKVGNDAIDISGTKLFLDNINISKVGDKAISAGEISHIKGKNININNVEIGITSKDGSSVVLRDINVNSTKLAITAFQKKSEYKEAFVDVENILLENVKMDHAIETRSLLTLNGIEIAGTVKDVDKMLYGNIYGKKTKK